MITDNSGELKEATGKAVPAQPRPVTLFTGQWADLPFEEMCRLAAAWGYDGLEIACWGDHFDVAKAAEDDSYVQGRKDLLEKHGLGCWAISNHLNGQAVCEASSTIATRTWSTRASGVMAIQRAYAGEPPKR